MTPLRLAGRLLAGLLVVACSACAEGPVGRDATPDRYESDDRDRRPASASPSSTPSSSPSASPTSEPLDPQRATDIASSVRLLPEDLPGSTAAPVDEQAGTALTATWQDYRSCAGADAERLAEVLSDGLSRTTDGAGQLAAATTAVLADPEALEAEVRAYRGADAAECARDLATQAVASLAGPDARVQEAEVSAVRPDVPAGASSFGHRVTTTVESAGRATPVSVDVVGVAAGRTEVLALLVSSGEELDAAERDALLRRLAGRAADAA